MKLPSLRKKQLPAIRGDLLVADFHSALINLVTNEVAQAEAKQSERNVTDALKYAGGDGVFTQPSDITPAAADYVTKNSVDAHLKKVQAEQINSFTTEQVHQLEVEDLKKYKGCKVRVTRLDGDKETFTSLWADNRNGKWRRSPNTSKTVTGAIDDLSFEQNALVLAPNFVSRSLHPDRKYYVVQVIGMDTLQPSVTIDLI